MESPWSRPWQDKASHWAVRQTPTLELDVLSDFVPSKVKKGITIGNKSKLAQTVNPEPDQEDSLHCSWRVQRISCLPWASCRWSGLKCKTMVGDTATCVFERISGPSIRQHLLSTWDGPWRPPSQEVQGTRQTCWVPEDYIGGSQLVSMKERPNQCQQKHENC